MLRARDAMDRDYAERSTFPCLARIANVSERTSSGPSVPRLAKRHTGISSDGGSSGRCSCYVRPTEVSPTFAWMWDLPAWHIQPTSARSWAKDRRLYRQRGPIQAVPTAS